jgi:hypothetical protein
MTQPLNYCTHACENMRALDDVIIGKQTPTVSRAILASAMECIVLMEKAEKFILPSWGTIFEKHEMELCVDVQIPTRLPYPIVAIEYPCPYDDPRCEPMLKHEKQSSKRIALCVETEALEEHASLLKHMHEEHSGHLQGFYVYPVSYSDDLKLWIPPPCAMFFPRGGNESLNALKEHGLTVILPLGISAYEIYPEKERPMRVMRDVADEAFSCLHLLTALAIDHGRYETLPAPTKLNKKRAQKGRVPMYEYKVLDIVADILQASPASKPHQGGTHASPRMHKRRGHVRRLSSGRTTWIRNMIIGKPGTGAVEKEYAVHE